ncbi:hypothetical protein CLV59_105265 [Chitinophaga dinghuensis]|uniref:Uncharacterized protein n=1 Tax=Chitinophaga dinghuensis TaxID=1539050 RepID=A0A327VVY2_9BACT|nr:hypothetical protein [Chitinophaga dinghuensis]RAJ80157.1 hypothetical protein CLV59_105265 [Chitinophaga dinghuensis]
MKEKACYTAIRLSPSLANFGENIYTGITPDHQKCCLFEYHSEGESVASFVIPEGGKEVYYQATGIGQKAIPSLIKGNITKYCLQEQGYFCLHASAVCVEDKTILFIGRKGAGKSTLAAYFHIKGHDIWSDDYSRLLQENKTFFIAQGETSLKINPDIASYFNIPAAQLKPVFETPPDWKFDAQSEVLLRKFFFHQRLSVADERPRKVTAVFFIGPRIATDQTVITRKSMSDSLPVLMQEILLPGVNSQKYTATYFQSALNLLEIVPFYEVNGPDNIRRIPEVYNAIIDAIS